MELERAIKVLTQYIDEYAVCDYAPLSSEMIEAVETATRAMRSIAEVQSGT